MSFDVVIVLIGFVFLILGLVGCFAPLVPGPQMSFVALLVLHFSKAISFSTSFLLMWAAIVILVTLIEYFIPIWGSKQFGGSTAGSWGGHLLACFWACCSSRQWVYLSEQFLEYW